MVPNDPEALTPTITKAREAGIVVVTHEAPGIAESVDLDVEAFVNEEFGKLMGEAVAQACGSEGQYAGFVGSLTMATHMVWYNAATEYIAENYPDMVNVAEEPYEDGNSMRFICCCFSRCRFNIHFAPLFICSVIYFDIPCLFSFWFSLFCQKRPLTLVCQRSEASTLSTLCTTGSADGYDYR